MYDPKTGMYYDAEATFQGEKTFRMESAYYIKYNSNRALFALERISDSFKGSLENRCFYYHFYLDALFNAVGMIITRFKPQKRAGKKLRLQSQINVQEYEYDSSKYTLLNDKSFRNFIEHIDERDEKLIEATEFHGTFNLIYPRMSKMVKKGLLNPDKPQNNLLNLCEMTYTILEYDKDDSSYKPKVIDLLELKRELISINETSKKLFRYL